MGATGTIHGHPHPNPSGDPGDARDAGEPVADPRPERDARWATTETTLSESHTASGYSRLTVRVPRRGPVRFDLREEAASGVAHAQRDVQLTVPGGSIAQMLRSLSDAPVEAVDPDLAVRLLAAIRAAVPAGAFPSTYPEVRRWLVRNGVPFHERRWTVTRSDP